MNNPNPIDKFLELAPFPKDSLNKVYFQEMRDYSEELVTPDEGKPIVCLFDEANSRLLEKYLLQKHNISQSSPPAHFTR